MSYSLPEFEGKHVICIGKGREGTSFETFIKANARIASFTFADQADDPDYLMKLMDIDQTTTVVVKSPGIPGSKVLVPYTTPTRIFFECIKQSGAKTIGVTGTKGKTTTASLIAFILKQNDMDVRLCGNIGVPMLDSLQDVTLQTIFVVELSSYQLVELETSPDIAVITNLYRDHIDYHGTLENYWEAKRNIMRFQTSEQTLVYNPDTEIVLHWIAESPAKTIAIDPKEDVDMAKCKLIGDHNKLNYLMARAVADMFGVSRISSQNALNKFEPVRHRLQPVRTVGGVTYIDDAIGSQPEATIAGITALIRKIGPVGCVMLGGQDRDYDFEPLVKTLSTLLIPKLVLFPETGAKIKALLPEGYEPECFETSDMEEAVRWASEHTPSGSICLLSTASPSYSIWKDFEEKGDLFQKAVLALPGY